MELYNQRTLIWEDRDRTVFLFDYAKGGTHRSEIVNRNVLKEMKDRGHWRLLRHPLLLNFVNEKVGKGKKKICIDEEPKKSNMKASRFVDRKKILGKGERKIKAPFTLFYLHIKYFEGAFAWSQTSLSFNAYETIF